MLQFPSPNNHSPSQHQSVRGNSRLLFVLIAVISIGIGLWVQVGQRSTISTPAFDKAVLLPNPRPLQEFSFTAHHGGTFTKQDLLGKWSLLFFGFTNCPDVCPTTLHTMSQVKKDLQAENIWENFQVVMVSVDPERDKIDRLAKYVPWFDSEFIGIAADADATKAFARQLNVPYKKTSIKDENTYEVDHYAGFVLVNPRAEYAGVLSGPHERQVITQDLIKLVGYSKQANFSIDSGREPQAPSNQTSQELGISKAWIRSAPPTASSMAAYMTLKNLSDDELVLTGVEATAFAMAMIHTTVVEDEVVSMKHLDELRIAPGETVSLEPMGKHLMLMQAQHSLPEGTHTTLEFIDQQGQRYPFSIEVKKGE